MGAGKSTVAALLAERVGAPGPRHRRRHRGVRRAAPIADIFVESGEEHFRALEAAAVARGARGARGRPRAGRRGRARPGDPRRARRPPGRVPACRSRGGGQARRPRGRSPAAARQRPLAHQGAARRAHPRLRVGGHRGRRHRRPHPRTRSRPRSRRPCHDHERRHGPARRRRVAVRRGRGPRPRRPAARACSASPSRRVAVLYAGQLGELVQPVVDALVDHYDVLALGPARRRGGQDRPGGLRLLGGARGGGLHPLGRRGRPSAAVRPPTWAASSRRPGCAACASCTCRPPCSGWSTRPSAARPASTPAPARTWSAPSTSRPASCATSTLLTSLPREELVSGLGGGRQVRLHRRPRHPGPRRGHRPRRPDRRLGGAARAGRARHPGQDRRGRRRPARDRWRRGPPGPRGPQLRPHPGARDRAGQRVRRAPR